MPPAGRRSTVGTAPATACRRAIREGVSVGDGWGSWMKARTRRMTRSLLTSPAWDSRGRQTKRAPSTRAERRVMVPSLERRRSPATEMVGTVAATRAAISPRSTARSRAIVQPCRSRAAASSAPRTGQPMRAREVTRRRHSGCRSRRVSQIRPPMEWPTMQAGEAGNCSRKAAASASTWSTRGSRRCQVRKNPRSVATTSVPGGATARPKASMRRLVSAQPCWEKSRLAPSMAT